MASLPRGVQIITALTDIDFYKITMAYFAWTFYRDTPVEYVFKNRTKGVDLGQFLNLRELGEQLEAVRTLRFTRTEIAYLRGLDVYGKQMFAEEFLGFLQDLQLPAFNLTAVPDAYGNSFTLSFNGAWPEVIFWETIALSIVNELYYQRLLRDHSPHAVSAVLARGVVNLFDKVDQLRSRPDVTFIEFGTRRRFSAAEQHRVVDVLKHELPRSQFLGTSNVKLAIEFDLIPYGSNGHEGPMVLGGVYGDTDAGLRKSPDIFLDQWYALFGPGLAILLTDTYGTDIFYEDAGEEIAANWRGARHDSGDPFEWTVKTMVWYRLRGVNSYNPDPKLGKLFLYSDGLELPLMFRLADYVKGKGIPTFGWGTNLTNDLGLPPLSIVVKVNKANGIYVAKLSDNLEKATGRPEAIARTKRVFGYTSTESLPVKY